jgi:hypothetical protein
MPAVSEETSLTIKEEQWDKFFDSLEEDRADFLTDLHLYAESEIEMSQEEAKFHKFRKAIFGEEGKREDFSETKLFFKTSSTSVLKNCHHLEKICSEYRNA